MSRLGTEIDRSNTRARAAARTVGRAVYQHQVSESWPGCVDCGRPIRWSAVVPGDLVGAYRGCGCQGRLWRCGLDGWVIAWSVMAGTAATAPAEGDGGDE